MRILFVNLALQRIKTMPNKGTHISTNISRKQVTYLFDLCNAVSKEKIIGLLLKKNNAHFQRFSAMIYYNNNRKI